MAGSEHSGIMAARTFLFDNAVWVLTPTPRVPHEVVETLRTFLLQLDVRPLILAPDVHDQIVAGISHLPYLMACSLVHTVMTAQPLQQEMLTLASTGFRDTTRVASSLPEWGKDICVTNKKAILAGISSLKKNLAEMEKQIKNGNPEKLEAWFGKVKQFRDGMY